MTLEEFIKLYNTNNAIILLEGKREVLLEDREKLKKLGNLLASNMPLANFRSGNAPGADELFSEGVISVDSSRFHVIIPDNKHRQRSRIGIQYHSLDDFQLTNEMPIIYEARQHSATSHLIDRYLAGHRDRTTPKIAPIIRDAVKVIGHGKIPRATVALFYDDLSKPEEGGTGFTMKTCRNNGVPLFDQRVWFKWF